MDSNEIKKIIESNANYWEKRALQNKLNIVENEEDYLKRIQGIYDKANRDIDNKLAVIYQRYAKENKMTLKEAYKKLPLAMEKEYKNDVMDYIAKARENSNNGKYSQYLLNQSLMHQHSVLDQMRTEYRNVIYNIDMEETGGKFLEKIYANANYYEQYNDNNENFARVDQNRIQNLLKENWSGGGNFSESIWKNKEQLVNTLDDIVMKGLATGESFDKMSNELAKRMNTSASNAKRLIMTESARMDNQGLLDWYKESGIKQIQFIATLDNRTSEICRAMDGKIINIEDAQIGLNIPPLHPYCRSVIAPYTEYTKADKRIYKDSNGKTQTGKNRTYAKYVEEELGDKEAARAIVSKSNSISDLVKATKILTPTASISVIDKTVRNITGYDVNKEYAEYVKRRQDHDIKYYEDKGVLSREELEEYFNEVKALLEDPKNEVAIRIQLDALEEILNSGKIANGFELDKIRNMVVNQRKEAEEVLFGIPQDAPASARPVYGYLSNQDLENGMTGVKVNMYGDIKIILKNKVKDYSTFTFGDSLDRMSTLFPSRLTDIKLYSIYHNELESVHEGGLRMAYQYPEVQIFKKLKLDDIYEIQVPKKYKSTKLTKLFKKKGVTVSWY